MGETVINVIAYIAFGGIFGFFSFAALILWMNWYTNVDYKELVDRDFKTIVSVIVLGTLIVVCTLSLFP